MRIAHVTDFYLPRLGGIEWHVHDLAARQHAAGHSVDIITASPAVADDEAVDLRGLSDGPVVHRVLQSTAVPSLMHPAAPGAGRRIVRRGAYDVVHVHIGLFTPLAYVTAGAATRSGIPVAVTLHSLLPPYTGAFSAADRLIRWCRWPIAWSAVSDYAAGPLRTVLRDNGEVAVLPNGIDPERWAVEPVSRDTDDVLAVAVMRLTARKRPMPLLRMLRQARAALPPESRLRAVIIGEGPERATMERYLRRHDMESWVSMPGRFTREQIHDFYARADLFIAPATLESFGIAALEARCAGLPIVARRQGGVSEFVRHGIDGLLADSDDTMVSAITALASSARTRQAMAGHNRAVPPAVSWDNVLPHTYQLYDRAARLAGRAPAGQGLLAAPSAGPRLLEVPPGTRPPDPW